VSALAELQRSFIDAIFADDAVPRPGMEIYRRNVLANLRHALAAAYPVVQRLVGEAFFGEAAAVFARAHPSRSGDLHEFGGAFAAFLEAYAPARAVPCLADVARLEWACHQSGHAADAEPFDFAALAQASPGDSGRLRFGLQPAVRMVDSPHPIAAIWEANQPGNDGRPARTEGPDTVLVWREGYAVRITRLEPFERELLARIARGATLEEASAALTDEQMSRFLPEALARYVDRDILSGPVRSGRGA
jgi:hypothetical protein